MTNTCIEQFIRTKYNENKYTDLLQQNPREKEQLKAISRFQSFKKLTRNVQPLLLPTNDSGEDKSVQFVWKTLATATAYCAIPFSSQKASTWSNTQRI